ncbi:MAG TPA: cytochrome c oxidase subunit 3 [Dehalococcoidia bacterium]|nr:cytochrome c oxidase subunit 3 [Dehalococcoidia bacterium]
MTALDSGLTLPPARPVSGSRAPAWWGMLCLIATEATLFVLLIFSYFYLRWGSPNWPPQGTPRPEFTVIIPATVLLLGSSAPVMWAETAIRRGRQNVLRLGLSVAWLMAAVFVILELWEWSHLGFGPQSSQYASIFFTITGLHLAHVSIALLMSAYIQLRASRGHFDAQHFLAVENVALYWHFVDVVWIFVFATVYISPYVT